MKTIYWIDDDESRFSSGKNLIEGGISKRTKKANVTPFSAADRDTFDVLNDVLKSSKPDLILIDHMLTASKSTRLKEGSTFAAALRENWLDVPIVCLTAKRQGQKKKFGYLKEQQYTAVFDWSQSQEYFDEIHSIADGFAKLKGVKSFKDLAAKVLKCPKEDQELLISLIKVQALDPTDVGFPHVLTRWLREYLISLPGLLIDTLSAATFIGLNQNGFNKISSSFDSALYTGPFSTTNNPRWWRSAFQQKLLELVPESESVLPWTLGRKLKGIKKSDFSQCYTSGEDMPEVVAYTDRNKSDLVPVKIKFTEQDSTKAPILIGFEPYRIIKGQ